MSIARLMQMASAGVTTGGTGSEWTDPDLTNASYDSVSFSVAGQDTIPRDLQFDETGTKLFVLGIVTDDVFQYSLSSAWDISTASYTSSVSIGGGTYGMYFRGDGTKLYIMDIGGYVYQWSLSSAWDVTTATYDAVSFSVISQDASPRDVSFSEDGTKMYVLGAYNDKVYQYTCSTAWDISTATYDSVEFSVVGQDTSPLGIVFNPSGTKFWIYGFANQSVFEYSLSSAWDMSTASYSSTSFSTASQLSNGLGLVFSSDGAKMYVSANTGDTIYQYSTTPSAPATWTDPDLANASYDSVSFSVAGQDTAPQGLFFKPDGTKLYVIGSSGDDVNEYDLSTAWDVSTASYVQNFSVAAQEYLPQGLFFKPDGSKMYIAGSFGDEVNEYDLSTAWDVSTASYLQNFSVAAQEGNSSGLFFKPDGSKMYIVGYTGDDVNEYDLSTAWDISSASYLQNFSVAAQDTSPQGFFFKPDGSKMYVVGASIDTIYQYSTN